MHDEFKVERWYTTKELYTALKSAGANWCTYDALLWNERRGRFTPLKNARGARRFTKKMIEEIVRAFTPGGSGEWHVDKRR